MIVDLEIILSGGESDKIEFKESADKTLASEVCAFANAKGGCVFVGVNDKGEIVGTDTGNTARSRIQDTINQIEPPLSVDIAIHDDIIVITVPEGPNKPYSCAKGFYLRSGPNSQKMQRDSIVDFLQTEGRLVYDSVVSEEDPIDVNFNEAEYARYLRKSDISPVLPRDAILRNLQCAGIARNGNLSYTNAGLLFFRKNSDEVRFDFSHVVCATYRGTGKALLIDAKNLMGGILENIDETMAYLWRNLRVHHEIKWVQRRDVLELPEDALREAITNAVCHRDYTEKGARVMVEIFDDRVEITNPGGAPKGITKENFGVTSVTRNPVIASLLHRAHYIERMGSGIMKMNSAMEAEGRNKPTYQTEGYFFKVVFEREELYGPNGIIDGARYGAKDVAKVVVKGDANVVKDDVNDVKDVVYGVNDDVYDVVKDVVNGAMDVVNESQVILLDFIKQDGSVTIPRMAQHLGISQRQTQRLLKPLVDGGLVTRSGGRRQGIWQVAEREVPYRRV